MPIESLINLLQKTTSQLITAHQEVAVSEGAYHRKFWTVWQQLNPDAPVAAKNRECESQCKELSSVITVDISTREGLIAKRDALVAILAARTK
jgi:hypothetical protein